VLTRGRFPQCLVAGLFVLVITAALGATPAHAAALAVCHSGVAQDVHLGPPPTVRPWALERLHPESSWSLSRGAGVTVAIIDSGVSVTHALLPPYKVAPGVDFLASGTLGRCDEAGHGTMIAGIIAAYGATGLYSGIAPDATILPIRIIQGERSDEDLSGRIADAIRLAVDRGATIINLSIRCAPSTKLANAIKDALDKNIVIVAAAGNVDPKLTGLPYPVSYDGVLGVAGIDEAGRHVESSMVGPFVDVAAPGAGLIGLSPIPSATGNNYQVDASGTSYAAAYVSGVAALIRSHDRTLTGPQIVDRIIETADPPPEGHSDSLGYGVVNPYRALTAVLGTRPNPPAAELPPPLRVVDPFATQKRLAAWAAVGGTAFALVIFFAGGIIRSGRRRRWRAG
jgi:membrane-anchored mycosin MYCP